MGRDVAHGVNDAYKSGKCCQIIELRRTHRTALLCLSPPDGALQDYGSMCSVTMNSNKSEEVLAGWGLNGFEVKEEAVRTCMEFASAQFPLCPKFTRVSWSIIIVDPPHPSCPPLSFMILTRVAEQTPPCADFLEFSSAGVEKLLKHVEIQMAFSGYILVVGASTSLI
jgi:hypothetical protein